MWKALIEKLMMGGKGDYDLRGKTNYMGGRKQKY